MSGQLCGPTNSLGCVCEVGGFDSEEKVAAGRSEDDCIVGGGMFNPPTNNLLVCQSKHQDMNCYVFTTSRYVGCHSVYHFTIMSAMSYQELMNRHGAALISSWSYC